MMQRTTHSFPAPMPVTSVSVIGEGPTVEVSLLNEVGAVLTILRFASSSVRSSTSEATPEERLIARCESAEADLDQIREIVAPGWGDE